MLDEVVDISDPRHETMLTILQSETRKRSLVAELRGAIGADVGFVLIGTLTAFLIHEPSPEAAAAAKSERVRRSVRFVSHTLSPDAPELARYHRAIETGTPRIVPCWGGELEDSRLANNLTLRWNIRSDGGVIDVSAAQEIPDEVLACNWVRVVTAFEPTNRKWWRIYAQAKGIQA